MASKTQEKSIDIVHKAWYNNNGEHRWWSLPTYAIRNNRLQFGRWAVISFYLSRRLSKYSARAISKDKIISNSTNVMYKVTTSPRFYSKGEKRNFRSPRKKGSNRHRMVHSGYVSTEIIIHEPSKYVKTKLPLCSKCKKKLQPLCQITPKACISSISQELYIISPNGCISSSRR